MDGRALPAPERPAVVDREALLAEVREFTAGTMAEWGAEIERTRQVGRHVWEELSRRGYLTLGAPAEWGGGGLDLPTWVEVLEEFSHAHGSLRMIVHVSNGIWRPTAHRATPEQIARFVLPQLRGEHMITFTLTEPGNGSGADLQTTARREGDHYILHGAKHLITFGLVADYYLLLCRVAGSHGAEGITALLVPRDAPGLTAEPMSESIGLAGTDHAHIVMRDCRVPVANRLGEEGEGLEIALRGFLDPSRICVAASCVGLAQESLDLAVARARQRVTFGQPLARRQVIKHMLADMDTDVEAARQLVQWAARTWEAEPPAVAAASKAKLFASEALQRVTDKALQIWGGVGYFEESPMARLYRDARAQRFEEGTAEIQKATIAKYLVG